MERDEEIAALRTRLADEQERVKSAFDVMRLIAAALDAKPGQSALDAAEHARATIDRLSSEKAARGAAISTVRREIETAIGIIEVLPVNDDEDRGRLEVLRGVIRRLDKHAAPHSLESVAAVLTAAPVAVAAFDAWSKHSGEDEDDERDAECAAYEAIGGLREAIAAWRKGDGNA